MFLIILVALPETLFFRNTAQSQKPLSAHPLRNRLKLWGFREPGRRLHWRDIIRPFQMCVLTLLLMLRRPADALTLLRATYPSVILCATYYSVLVRSI